MEINLPVIPAGILTLLSLLAPYVIAIINRPTWSASTKRVVSVAASVILAAVVILGYFWYTRDVVPDWPVLILLAIVVVQASYALVTKDAGAARVEARTDGGFAAREAEEKARMDAAVTKAIASDGRVRRAAKTAVDSAIAARDDGGHDRRTRTDS